MHQQIDNACLTETIGLSSGAVKVQAGSRPHRHNEVELNFLERGALTYLFGKQPIVVSAGQFLLAVSSNGTWKTRSPSQCCKVRFSGIRKRASASLSSLRNGTAIYENLGTTLASCFWKWKPA